MAPWPVPPHVLVRILAARRWEDRRHQGLKAPATHPRADARGSLSRVRPRFHAPDPLDLSHTLPAAAQPRQVAVYEDVQGPMPARISRRSRYRVSEGRARGRLFLLQGSAPAGNAAGPRSGLAERVAPRGSSVPSDAS